MGSKLKALAWAIVGVAVLGGAVLAVRRSTGAIDLGEIDFEAVPLVLATIVFVVSFLYTALLWHTFLTMAGAATSRLNDAGTWLISQFGKYVPGNVTVIAIRIARSPGRPAAVTNAFIQEAAFQVVVGGVIAIPAVGLALNTPGVSPWLAAAAAPFVALVLFPGVFRRIVNWMLVRVRREPLSTPVPSMKQTLALVLAYVIFWALAGTSFWLFVGSISDGLSWFDATTAIAFAWIVGFLAFAVPGGIGVREAALVLTLGPLLGSGEALVIAAAQRAWLTLLDVALSGSGFLLARSAGHSSRELLGPERPSQ